MQLPLRLRVRSAKKRLGGKSSTSQSNASADRKPVRITWPLSNPAKYPQLMFAFQGEMENNMLSVNAAPLGKARQIQEAKRFQQQVLERAARRGAQAPNYEFLELTGKGSYGRVFKWYVLILSLLLFSFYSSHGTICH
jgi:hypothetical protein